MKSGSVERLVRRLLKSAPLAIGLLLLASENAAAWGVYNSSSRPVRARVLEGDWDVEIQPGESASCHWSDTDCNPSGSQTGLVTLQVETLDGDSRDFNVVSRMEAGGYGDVLEETRPLPWSAPHNMYVETYRANGSLYSRLPHGVGAASRRVHFLISADCQYCADGDCTETDAPNWTPTANAMHSHMVNRLGQDSSIRGLCYAGDLTQFASSGELDTYLDSFRGATRYVFDGLGNHDIDNGRSRVRDSVTSRKRVTVKSQKGDPHYSWDWHDVHLVQLNLMPSDTPAPDSGGNQFSHIDPMGALSFLIIDLAIHVGNSGRPVILMHHYGFESFSTDNGWWTADQRKAYWNAIASYNVVGIFTGHLHPGPGTVNTTQRYVQWNRPAGATGGPDSIPTFVSGAGRYGAYLEVDLNAANQLAVTVRDQTGAQKGVQYYASKTPVWVNAANPAPGYGWKDDPFPTLGEAVNATATRLPDIAVTADVRVQAGTYSEAVRITQPTRLTLNGSGSARIGR